MSYLLPTFKLVSLIFAGSAIVTGAQAIVNPVGFSRSFGIPLNGIVKTESKSTATATSDLDLPSSNPVTSYVSLMGIRQFATGVTILTFAYQKKWIEIATILSILGIVVAGTDGIYLAKHGTRNQAKFHAIPGALIALLAASVHFVNV